jgi:hypothetical protein
VKKIEKTIGELSRSIDFRAVISKFLAEKIPGLNYLVVKFNEAISGNVITHPLYT